LKIAVVTICPLKSTFLGSPTFTESTFIGKTIAITYL
jgi:hypothetical protein